MTNHRQSGQRICLVHFIKIKFTVTFTQGGRVAFDTGSRFGGLDLAAALGLSGMLRAYFPN